MKKTMITLAAMFAATVTMAAVTSQIVGYKSYDWPQNGAGGTFYVPTFSSIGGNPKLSDLKGNFADWEDNVQQMLQDGSVMQTIALWTDADGWVDPDTTEPIDLEFTPGQGYMIFSTYEGLQVTGSGEVNTNSVELSWSEAGVYITGNSTVTDRMLSEITFAGLADWEDNLQIVSSDGNCVTVALWTDADGWIDPDTTEPIDFAVKAGDAFSLVLTYSNPATMSIPSALTASVE